MKREQIDIQRSKWLSIHGIVERERQGLTIGRHGRKLPQNKERLSGFSGILRSELLSDGEVKTTPCVEFRQIMSHFPTANASRIASGCSLATASNVFTAPLNFAGAAFPFADDGEGDAGHGGEVLLGVIEFLV